MVTGHEDFTHWLTSLQVAANLNASRYSLYFRSSDSLPEWINQHTHPTAVRPQSCHTLTYHRKTPASIEKLHLSTGLLPQIGGFFSLVATCSSFGVISGPSTMSQATSWTTSWKKLSRFLPTLFSPIFCFINTELVQIYKYTHICLQSCISKHSKCQNIFTDAKYLHRMERKHVSPCFMWLLHRHSSYIWCVPQGLGGFETLKHFVKNPSIFLN